MAKNGPVAKLEEKAKRHWMRTHLGTATRFNEGDWSTKPEPKSPSKDRKTAPPTYLPDYVRRPNVCGLKAIPFTPKAAPRGRRH